MPSIFGKVVPESYQELARECGHNRATIPGWIYDYGIERYNGSAEKYKRETVYGRVNACYLPETDTFEDVKEELLDAFFNTLVLLWKMGDNRALHELLGAQIDFLQKFKAVQEIHNNGRLAQRLGKSIVGTTTTVLQELGN